MASQRDTESSLPDSTPGPKVAPITPDLSCGDHRDPALEGSSLPPPNPWLETTTSSPAEPAEPGACCLDGPWFLKLLQVETERLQAWCRQMDQETKENRLPEEILGKVLSAVGSAQLLIAQKFQQFRGLCELSVSPDAQPRPTAQDLAGFWDLLQLSIEDISRKFEELHRLKANNWQLGESPEMKEEKKASPWDAKKPAKSKPPVRSPDKASDARDKQHQEARKRFLAAKRATSEQLSAATGSADSVEIYSPGDDDAQTRPEPTKEEGNN